MHNAVTIIDVSPRDGLQNEPSTLAPVVRAELVRRLVAAGVPRIEIGSFVNPSQMPHMAGMPQVCAALGAGTHDPQFAYRYVALVPNARGYELALQAGMRQVRFALAVSESLNQANFRRSVATSLADLTAVVKQARQARQQVGFGVVIAASWGCPFEGAVPAERVLGLARQLASLGVDEIVLADTTGMAVPTGVQQLCREALRLLHDGPTVTVHFHNTRNTGYANALAAWQAGITSFDTALGGIGGCPFAPRAVGNIATEDLIHMFNGMGVASGIDLALLLEASAWLGTQLGKPLPALVGRAEPVFPTAVAPG